MVEPGFSLSAAITTRQCAVTGFAHGLGPFGLAPLLEKRDFLPPQLPQVRGISPPGPRRERDRDWWADSLPQSSEPAPEPVLLVEPNAELIAPSVSFSSCFD